MWPIFIYIYWTIYPYWDPFIYLFFSSDKSKYKRKVTYHQINLTNISFWKLVQSAISKKSKSKQKVQKVTNNALYPPCISKIRFLVHVWKQKKILNFVLVFHFLISLFFHFPHIFFYPSSSFVYYIPYTFKFKDVEGQKKICIMGWDIFYYRWNRGREGVAGWLETRVERSEKENSEIRKTGKNIYTILAILLSYLRQ